MEQKYRQTYLGLQKSGKNDSLVTSTRVSVNRSPTNQTGSGLAKSGAIQFASLSKLMTSKSSSPGGQQTERPFPQTSAFQCTENNKQIRAKVNPTGGPQTVASMSSG